MRVSVPVPEAAELPMVKIPPLTTVPPEKVFAPESATVPPVAVTVAEAPGAEANGAFRTTPAEVVMTVAEVMAVVMLLLIVMLVPGVIAVM